MGKESICETCVNYVFEEDYECYSCQANLDEDEMAGFLQNTFRSCPYYRKDDEYGIVKKQM